MASFMEKLKGKGVAVEDVSEHKETPAPNAPPAEIASHHALQLPIDVYQSDSEIVIFAQIAGVDVDSLDVAIGGEQDVIELSGKSMRPDELVGDALDGDFSLEECAWGDFYRQIILPEPIEPEEAEAKEKDGVLVLILPLKGHHKNLFKMNVVRVD